MAPPIYAQLYATRHARVLRRYLRALLARPDLCGPSHDEQMYHLARACGHDALYCQPELCPGWELRY